MLSSDLNCLSVVGVEDLLPKLKPHSTDQQRLYAGKIIVALCGAVAVIDWPGHRQIFNRVLSSYYIVTSIIAAGMAGLFLLAFLSPRANRQGVYIGASPACFSPPGTLTSGKDPTWILSRFNFKLIQ